MDVRNEAHLQLYLTTPNRQVFGVLQKMRNSVTSAEKGQYIFEIGAVGTFCSAGDCGKQSGCQVSTGANDC